MSAVLRLRHFNDRPRVAPRPGSRPGAQIGAAPPIRLIDDMPATACREASLLSHSAGRIEHIFMAAPARLPGAADGMAERLLRLAASFPRTTLAVHQSDVAVLDALLQQLAPGARVDLIPVPDDADLWTWVQDRFLLVRDAAGEPWLVESPVLENRPLSDAAAWACGASGRLVPGVPLAGGNILADAETCFVGMDLCGDDPDVFKWRFAQAIESRRAIRLVGCSRPLRRRGLERFEIRPGDLSWRQDLDRCIAYDGARQPVFHLDIFLTPAGRGRDGRQRILVGDPVWAGAITGIGLPEGFPAEAFEEVAGGLRFAGFEVIRNPLPFIYFDDPESRLREWFYASANNCLVEHVAGEGSRVFLPEYGFGAWSELAATDAVNAAIWRELDFDVVPGGDFLPLADQLGALNCVSKVLARG